MRRAPDFQAIVHDLRMADAPVPPPSGDFLAATAHRESSEDDQRTSLVRSTALGLVWVCGDCGEHYSLDGGCPLVCDACGAPRQHFYVPIED